MSDSRENSENYWKVVAGLLFLAFIYQGWCRNKAEIRCNELSAELQIKDRVFKDNTFNWVQLVHEANWNRQMGRRFEND